MLPVFYAYLCNYLFWCSFISLCGFKLSSGIISFQPQRLHFSTFFKEGLLAVNFLNLCLSQNVFILTSFLKDSFSSHQILGWHIFLLVLWICYFTVCLAPLFLVRSLLLIWCLLFSSAFIFLFSLNRLTMMYLGMDLFVSILLGVFYASLMCKLMLFITFGRFLAIICSNISSSPFSGLSIWDLP